MPRMTRNAPVSSRITPSRPRVVAVSVDVERRVHCSRWRSVLCLQTNAAPRTASTPGMKNLLSEPIEDSTPIRISAATRPASSCRHRERRSVPSSSLGSTTQNAP